jgi:hypothetical protein
MFLHLIGWGFHVKTRGPDKPAFFFFDDDYDNRFADNDTDS